MPGGYKRSRALWEEARRPGAPFVSTLRAIAYELQPVRFSSIDASGWRARIERWRRSLVQFGRTTVPSTACVVWGFVSTLSGRNWLIVAGIVVYYIFVRTLHELLDAGPIIMILTALAAIFTVGLGEESANPHRISAYSVFNRGFQRLMGSVDAENLLQQHVGGGMMGVLPNNNPADGLARMPRHQLVGDDDDDEEDDDDDQAEQPDNQRNGGPSRKSGKKARRRDLQQRRELQRQRRAAMEMGFGEGDDNVAMQRLIEEQIAAARQVDHNPQE